MSEFVDLSALALPAAILGGVGLTFGTLIAVANRFLRVVEDPRVEAVTEMLPGSNCGACGFAGCRAFAESVVGGAAQPAGCTQMSAEAIGDVASYLGVDAGTAVKRVARLLCAGGRDVASQHAEYRGLPTCAAAAVVACGGKACTWGCIGLADCEVSCDYDAIHMTPHGLPLVDPDRCTACGDCVEACPKDLFMLLPMDRHLLVQCKSLLEGEPAEAICRVACTACGKCAMDAPEVVSIVNGLAVVDPAQAHRARPEATARCPTGAIVWVEGAQRFAGAPTRSATA